VTGALGNRTTHLWDGTHPDTPKVDPLYLWPQPETAAALTQIARGRNVLLFGPAGAGKTAWACQLAARLGRPFALISAATRTRTRAPC
jgi:MoxR-like ATPase